MKLYLVIGALQPLIQGTLPSSRFDWVTKNRLKVVRFILRRRQAR